MSVHVNVVSVGGGSTLGNCISTDILIHNTLQQIHNICHNKNSNLRSFYTLWVVLLVVEVWVVVSVVEVWVEVSVHHTKPNVALVRTMLVHSRYRYRRQKV